MFSINLGVRPKVQMFQRIVVVALLLLVAVGCDATSRPDTSAKRVFDEELNTQLAEIASMLPKVGSTVIHEGLPHRSTDPAFKTESQRTDAFEFAGYMFYQAEVDLSEREKTALNSVLSNPKSYKRWIGEKLCDGFHPDWSIDWDINGTHTRFMLCFGCEEIKVVLPDKEWRFDMSDGTKEKLKSILFSHHISLPQPSRYPY